jgi:long-chain acyl-CoA synthetase
VGQPLVGTEVQILDETGTLLSPYATGEIWVKSPSIMSAYYNHPDQTALQLKDGWLFTGDIGYIDLDHYLYVVERKED